MGGLYESDFVQRLQNGVESLLANWGLSPQSQVTLLTVSENATFRVVDTESPRDLVVRVHRPLYHTREEIASELAWIAALREAEVVVTPAPIAQGDGSLIAGFDDRGDTRDAVAFEFMSGEEPAEGHALAEGFRELGAISARLHQHARDWQRPEGFTRKSWKFETIVGDSPHWGPWQKAIGLDDTGRDVLSQAVDELERRTRDYGMEPSRFGLIHADLRLANLLDDGARLAVIDFDDCGFGWYGFDFAAAVSFIEREAYIPALLSAWTEGYRSIDELSEDDEAMIPTFVMLRRLQLTAWLASHSETPTALEIGDTFTDGTVVLARRFLDGQQPFGA